MKADNLKKLRADRVWLTTDHCDIGDFAALVQRTTSAATIRSRARSKAIS